MRHTAVNVAVKVKLTSSQHGGVGRHIVPPHTTKRTTTNLKTQNNQNCQKIELHGSPTTKELKKHSSRPVRGADTGSLGGEDSQQSGRSHICVQKNGEGHLGRERERLPNPGFQCGEINPQNL